MPDKNLWTADRRLYLDRAGKVVEADDPTRATLLAAGPGATIPYAQAEALGLAGGAVLGAAPDAAPAAPAERKPGPDDPASAYAYLGGDTPPAESNELEGDGSGEALPEFDGTVEREAGPETTPKGARSKPGPAENKAGRKPTEDK